jgi:cell division topological specificity factor
MMRNFINKVLNVRPPTKNEAKKRLQVLLIHDQVDITPAHMEDMRSEILDVVSKYLDIDPESMEIKLDKDGGKVALVSTLPVKRVTARAS